MKVSHEYGMIILTCEFGYLIRKKGTEMYSTKIYLPATASVEDFEEVVDETIPRYLISNIVEMKQQEASLNKIGKLVANQVTDDVVALDIQEFYDVWASGVSYEVGRYIRHNDILYKVLQQHTSQDNWTPDVTPSLYAKVLIDPSSDDIPEWVQPDSTNAYMKGDKVRFEDSVYESLIDNNIWSPADYPAGWQKIEG